MPSDKLAHILSPSLQPGLFGFQLNNAKAAPQHEAEVAFRRYAQGLIRSKILEEMKLFRDRGELEIELYVHPEHMLMQVDGGHIVDLSAYNIPKTSSRRERREAHIYPRYCLKT